MADVRLRDISSEKTNLDPDDLMYLVDSAASDGLGDRKIRVDAILKAAKSFLPVDILPTVGESNRLYLHENNFKIYIAGSWRLAFPKIFQKQFSRYSLGVTSNNYFGTQNTATSFQAIQNLNTTDVNAIGWSRNTGVMRMPFKCRLISIAMQRPLSGTVNVAIAKSSNSTGGPEGVDAVLCGNYDLDNTVISNLNLTFLAGDYFHLAQKFIPTPAGTVYINDLTFIFEEIL